MKKLISGMFSSVPDAQLLLATTGYDEDAPENALDKFSEDGGDISLDHAEINSSAATIGAASYHEASNNNPDESVS
jgi:hypothetical protein